MNCPMCARPMVPDGRGMVCPCGAVLPVPGSEDVTVVLERLEVPDA